LHSPHVIAPPEQASIRSTVAETVIDRHDVHRCCREHGSRGDLSFGDEPELAVGCLEAADAAAGGVADDDRWSRKCGVRAQILRSGFGTGLGFFIEATEGAFRIAWRPGDWVDFQSADISGADLDEARGRAQLRDIARSSDIDGLKLIARRLKPDHRGAVNNGGDVAVDPAPHRRIKAKPGLSVLAAQNRDAGRNGRRIAGYGYNFGARIVTDDPVFVQHGDDGMTLGGERCGERSSQKSCCSNY